MALLLFQVGRFQVALESHIGLVSRETPEPETHEVEAEVEQAPPYPVGFARNPDPTSPSEEDPSGLE